MALYIAGSIFIVLSIVWYCIQENSKKKKKFEEAKLDYTKAIDSGDTNALLDAERRMLLYK